MANNFQTNIPSAKVPLVEAQSETMSTEWYRFFFAIFGRLGGGGGGGIPTQSGGTGQITYDDGQLLIGNSTGHTLDKATLTPDVGIGITNGAGSITIKNTGVTKIDAGTGIGVNTNTGEVTVTNDGVIHFSGGTTGLTPNTPSTGDITLAGVLGIGNGGTNANSAANARTNLGLGSGLSVTIATAKLTTLGVNGSMTFTNGILTAETAAT